VLELGLGLVLGLGLTLTLTLGSYCNSLSLLGAIVYEPPSGLRLGLGTGLRLGAVGNKRCADLRMCGCGNE